MKKLIQLFIFKNWESNLVFYTTLMFYIVFIIGFTYKGILDLDMFLIISTFPVIGYYAAYNMDSR